MRIALLTLIAITLAWPMTPLAQETCVVKWKDSVTEDAEGTNIYVGATKEEAESSTTVAKFVTWAGVKAPQQIDCADIGLDVGKWVALRTKRGDEVTDATPAVMRIKEKETLVLYPPTDVVVETTSTRTTTIRTLK